MTNFSQIGFGRMPHQDPKSLAYRVEDHPKAVAAPTPRSYTWGLPVGQMLNQLNTPRCVGFSCAHEIAARPAVRAVTSATGDGLYLMAQSIDREEGRVWDEGASILAGAKALQRWGRLKEYRWATSVEELALGVSRIGPAILGLDWFGGMMEPDADGYIWPTGSVVGGHAVLDRGYKRYSPPEGPSGRHLIQNSWGTSWGGRGGAPLGCAFLSDEALRTLMARPYADACLPIVRT